MPTEQYSVLGEAPDSLKLQKLSSNDYHLSIENLNAGYGKMEILHDLNLYISNCLLYTSPSPRDLSTSRMPSSA